MKGAIPCRAGRLPGDRLAPAMREERQRETSLSTGS